MECWHCPKERLCCSAMEQQYLCPSVCGLGALLLEETCSLPHRLVALRERKEQAAAPRLVLGCALEVALSPWEWGQRGPEGKETACRLSLPWLITVCCSLLFKKKKKKQLGSVCSPHSLYWRCYMAANKAACHRFPALSKPVAAALFIVYLVQPEAKAGLCRGISSSWFLSVH